MSLKIYEDSKNYVCQVIKLPVIQKIEDLDNLVKVNIQGNDCLIGKNTNPEELHLFFPAECQLSHEFCAANNLYRHSELNADKNQKGFFEDNRRVKALKFKGIISSGFVIPINSLKCLNNFYNGKDYIILRTGDEFNEFNGVEICKKYTRKVNTPNSQSKKEKTINKVVDSKFVPEHFDTVHLMKYADQLNLNDYIAVTYKLHGTSARFYNTLVKRPLSIIDRIAKFFGVKVVTEHYDYVCASRRVVKSVGFEELPDKNHFYTGDLWSKLGKECFEDKLNHGEAVYCEIIGKNEAGEAIQSGYAYGFNKPKAYIYRISNINSQGIEIDLPYFQMKERIVQLGVDYCPELFYGKLEDFISQYIGMNDPHTIEKMLDEMFNEFLLEKPSILDPSVVEEGFCIRVDKYPRPTIYKIKSKKFLLHEGALLDKEVVDIEEGQS